MSAWEVVHLRGSFPFNRYLLLCAKRCARCFARSTSFEPHTTLIGRGGCLHFTDEETGGPFVQHSIVGRVKARTQHCWLQSLSRLPGPSPCPGDGEPLQVSVDVVDYNYYLSWVRVAMGSQRLQGNHAEHFPSPPHPSSHLLSFRLSCLRIGWENPNSQCWFPSLGRRTSLWETR